MTVRGLGSLSWGWPLTVTRIHDCHKKDFQGEREVKTDGHLFYHLQDTVRVASNKRIREQCKQKWSSLLDVSKKITFGILSFTLRIRWFLSHLASRSPSLFPTWWWSSTEFQNFLSYDYEKLLFPVLFQTRPLPILWLPSLLWSPACFLGPCSSRWLGWGSSSLWSSISGGMFMFVSVPWRLSDDSNGEIWEGDQHHDGPFSQLEWGERFYFIHTKVPPDLRFSSCRHHDQEDGSSRRNEWLDLLTWRMTMLREKIFSPEHETFN